MERYAPDFTTCGSCYRAALDGSRGFKSKAGKLYFAALVLDGER